MGFFAKKSENFLIGVSRSESGMTCKGIKRGATCGLAFDTRSSQASKGNDMHGYQLSDDLSINEKTSLSRGLCRGIDEA